MAPITPEIPYAFLLVTIVAIAVSGIAWTTLAARAATRGELILALCNE